MKYSSFLLIIAVLAGSCNLIDTRIRGNGKIITQNYNLKDFKGIDIGGAKQIFLKQDSAFSVKVKTDENLFDHLSVRVDNEELKISSKNGKWLSPSDELKIFVTMPVVKKIEVSGASSVSSENRLYSEEKISVDLSGASEGTLDVRAPILDLTVSGASTLTVLGETRDIKSDASGASTINTFDLKSENCVVEASGASSIDVFASISLKANASGASEIKYKGNPPTIKQHASGGSDVKRVSQ